MTIAFAATFVAWLVTSGLWWSVVRVNRRQRADLRLALNVIGARTKCPIHGCPFTPRPPSTIRDLL